MPPHLASSRGFGSLSCCVEAGMYSLLLIGVSDGCLCCMILENFVSLICCVEEGM